MLLDIVHCWSEQRPSETRAIMIKMITRFERNLWNDVGDVDNAQHLDIFDTLQLSRGRRVVRVVVWSECVRIGLVACADRMRFTREAALFLISGASPCLHVCLPRPVKYTKITWPITQTQHRNTDQMQYFPFVSSIPHYKKRGVQLVLAGGDYKH